MLHHNRLKITALAGGTGAARFLEGLIKVVNPAELTIIVNTADDIDFFDLHISPDIDIVIYTLSSVVHETKGWGFRNDRFSCLQELKQLGHEIWFRIGDRDFATHLHRTLLLKQGYSLTEVVDSIRKRHAVIPRILPMTEDKFVTKMVTESGELHFQEYLVKRKARDRVVNIVFEGAEGAKPSPGVLKSIHESNGIVLCPSNPFVSIGPILAVNGIREALRTTSARIAAISPIVNGKALKGPAAAIMAGLGMEVSAYQVAKLYSDFLDFFVIDEEDRPLKNEIESMGFRAIVTNTIMKDLQSKIFLAETVCAALMG